MGLKMFSVVRSLMDCHIRGAELMNPYKEMQKSSETVAGNIFMLAYI